MTLILALTCPYYAFQVTDRLVTQLSSKKPFDPMANKNLIYRARDAVVSIGYTGLAYINKIPTDNWIAERLQGISPLAEPEPLGMRFGVRAGTPWLDIGQSVELLRTELNKALDLDSRRSFELVIVGWKTERKRCWTPMIWSLEHDGPSGKLKTIRGRRDWYIPRWNLVAAPQLNISLALQKSLLTKLKQSKSVGTIEEVLVEGIREIAIKNHAVGPNCMSIDLPHPNRSRVLKASYYAITQGQAVMYTDKWSRIVPAAYSPWLIGPTTSIRPAIFIGKGWRFGLNGFEVQLDGPESPGGPRLFFGSQDRKKLP